MTAVNSRGEGVRLVPVRLFGRNGVYRTAVTGADGTATFFSLPPGRYQVLVCRQCKCVTLSVARAQGALTFCYPELDCTGAACILLLAAESGVPLALGEFGLYQDNLLLARGRTGADGRLCFSGIPCAKYELRQLAAPPGYVSNREVRSFTLSRAGFNWIAQNAKKP